MLSSSVRLLSGGIAISTNWPQRALKNSGFAGGEQEEVTRRVVPSLKNGLENTYLKRKDKIRQKEQRPSTGL